MDAADAERALADAEVIPLLEAPLADAKELLAACLEEDIPALLGRDAQCARGCAPKAQLRARGEAAPRVAALMKRRWQLLAEREGTIVAAPAGAAPGGEGGAAGARAAPPPPRPPRGPRAPARPAA